MKYTGKIKCALLLLLTLLVLNCSSSSQPENYTATMVVAGMKMPITRLGQNMRVGNPVLKGVVIITLGEENKTITLSTPKKLYYEEPINTVSPNIYNTQAVIEKKHVSSEKLGDHPCEVYDATFYYPEHPDEKFHAKIWEAQDLKNLIVKTEMQAVDGSGNPITTELHDVKLGQAKPSMFEIPVDYVKADSLNQVMGLPSLNQAKKSIKGWLNKLKND